MQEVQTIQFTSAMYNWKFSRMRSRFFPVHRTLFYSKRAIVSTSSAASPGKVGGVYVMTS